jgi:hypothetical protein
MDAITTFERRRINNHKLYGRIIIESTNFTLLAVEYDFAFDGFQIIRNRDITKKIISKSNTYCTALMKREGAWITKLPRGLRKLDLRSWSTIFNGIKSAVLIAQNERVSRGFYIGAVVSVGSKAVTIHGFDGVGDWCAVESIPFAKITTCKFLDRYSSTHAKYLRWG